MLKKLIAIALVIMLLASLVACAAETPPVTQPDPPAGNQGADDPYEPDPVIERRFREIHWGSSSPGGGFFYAASILSPILTERFDYKNVTVIATGASADNVRRIMMGEIDFGMAHASDIYEAFTDGVEGLNPDYLRLVSFYMPGPISFTTLRRANIETMSDLAGLNVAAGQPGSGAQANAIRVLDTLGIDARRQYLQFEDAGRAIVDGHIDAISTTGIPVGAISELSNTQDIAMIQFSQAEMDILLDAFPFFYADYIPIGAYRGIMEPVFVPFVPMFIITHRDIPYYVIQDVLSTIFDPEVYAILGEGFGQWRFTKPGVDLMENLGVPIHPAALEFFTENPNGLDWSIYGVGGWMNFND